ncbi:hypothetical protein L218DRAFT_1073379 [Marasmius fiardii PR-910]|nr:hypothetical protein L218DRAFT_1073379 [Marasmius fiardii PR-910]
MNSSDLDENIPPPAYTEQEFDRKVANVLQASLADDEWEEWDEVKFEAAAAALRAGSDASSAGQSSSDVKKSPPTVYPAEKQGSSSGMVSHYPTTPDTGQVAEGALRARTNAPPAGQSSSNVKKPSPNFYPPEKQGSSSGMVSHYPVAPDATRPDDNGPTPHLHSTSHSPGQTSHAHLTSGPALESSQSHHQLPTSTSIQYEDEEDMSVPPPAFTGVGPSLDGPPYEEVMRLSYNPPGGEQAFPRLPSPSWSPQAHDVPLRPSSAATSIHSYPSQDLGVRSREESHNHPYPSTYSRQHANYVTRAPAATPRMDFNPAVAYGRPMMTDQAVTRTPAQVIDASAFYNSSVSSFLSVKSSQTVHSIPYQTKVLPSNPNSYNRSSPDHFSRHAFTSAPVSPIPTYPAVPSPPPNTFGFTHLPRRSSHQHLGPGPQCKSNEPRWAMSEQQFPF